MPLYEYECKKCGSVFEILQRLSDPPLAVHDKCGGRVERLISPPAFQFKGSGWYITDYGGKSSKEKAPEAPAAKEAKSGAAKPATDGKPSASKT
jgi:putative FmdB family regulatory protein